MKCVYLFIAGAVVAVFTIHMIPTIEGAAEIASATPTVDIRQPADKVSDPVGSRLPKRVVLRLEAREVEGRVTEDTTFTYWTFNGTVPGPLLRVRVGDTVELHLKNHPDSKEPHSIDLHAVNGPGGGSVATHVEPGQERVFTFKALHPGVYIYHCGTHHIPRHVAHGMYGLIVVEPAGGLGPVDREFYVVQGELYVTRQPAPNGHVDFDDAALLEERPNYVVFNGMPLALTEDRALKAKVGERLRIFVGNGGPNLIASFHIIGEIFDRVHPQGATEVHHNVQTMLIPAGGAAWVEFKVDAPGRYLLLDHALTRAMDKGALAYLEVEGPQNPDVFDAPESPSR